MAAKLHEKRKTGCLTFEAFFNELKIFSRQPNERQSKTERRRVEPGNLHNQFTRRAPRCSSIWYSTGVSLRVRKREGEN
jgi:hypothetical protein